MGRSFAKAWPVQRHASACDGLASEGDVIASCTHHVAAVRWLGAVRAVRRKGGQAANETTVLAICYLDNRHRRRRSLSLSHLSSPYRPFHLRTMRMYDDR